MADIIPSITSLIVPKLGHEPSERGGVREWIIRGSYQIDTASTSDEVILFNIDADRLISFICFDYERFALSSWESFSVSGMESVSRALVGWPLIKLYYSAFFASHAVMRSVGQGIVKIEKVQSDAINNIFFLVAGLPLNFKPGMYYFRIINDALGKVKISLKPHGEGSGVHEGFWKSFSAFLEELSVEAVARNLPDAANFVAGVGEITPMLKSDPQKKSVWFSAVRNEINYQHKYGIWFPLEKSKKSNALFSSLRLASSSSIRLDINRNILPVEMFVRLSHYLACLNVEVGDYVSARSQSSKSFGQNWRRFKMMSR